MTLSNTHDSELAITASEILDGSSNWDTLYCSHLWSNSHLRSAIINGNHHDNNKMIKYCYTCRGKIRKYEIRSPKDSFIPNTHSTPNGKTFINNNISLEENSRIVEDACSIVVPCNRSSSVHKNDEPIETENNQCIPSISRQVDSSLRQKYSSYEPRPNNVSHRRLRKSLKGIGCVVSLALTDTPVKKRTQIQACSIIVMIVAIVVITFVLVNCTSPNFKSNVLSSTAVPTQVLKSNESTSAIINLDLQPQQRTETTTSVVDTTTVEPLVLTTRNTSKLSDVLEKIRKNIKTFSKDAKKSYVDVVMDKKPKEINNRDLSLKFCSCQTDEVCMLNENSGTALCKKAIDIDDPTGCGGLCALETEACQLVDRARGVRVCRLLTLITCGEDEWRCRNGLCVDAAARCDGTIQCYDRSDEIHCDCDLTKQFRCGNSISCFPNSKLCDGVIDCWDGFDEVNCTTECPQDQFTCTDGQCIISSRFCDGLADCADGSDEPNGCDGACGTHEMRCLNRRCVPLTDRCNAIDNCGDNSDELQCS
ncbi:hypothetical protein JYU34_003493 [Plutella xylostella]|uniref:Uncharacterized protein n=1 Tax=Plutella xylostella TaxID=51655 RepID=A0ABQ7R066_PLUXY|nr:hypothetical protein JYU34_003493 [Plutella xylostella]